MKENAIIIRQLDVIKTYVDFSDIDNIYQAINADRVSTIHTAKTQELSDKLGVHLMGFVDREGDDINNKKACEISGYDYLGSFMLLCKTDDKFNALPFSEDELDRVYNYLTGGEVKSKSSLNKDELEGFFDKYKIKPVLPNFSIKPEVTFFENYQKVVLLTYFFGAGSGVDLGQIGGELFKYSDVLVKNFFEEDDAYVSPEETYCVKSKTDMGAGYFYLLIQVLEGRRDQPVIGNIDLFLDRDKAFSIPDFEDDGDEPEEIPEEPNDYEEVDEPEEYEEIPEEPNDYEEVDEPEEYEEAEDEEFSTNADFLVPYFIIVEIEATWPEFEQTSCKYKYCYPMLQAMEPPEDQPFFPYFHDLIKVLDFDMFGDTVDIRLNLGEEKRKVHLESDEPYSFEFDYTPGKPSSHRYGKMTLTFERHEIDFVEVEGTIRITESVLEISKSGYNKVLNKEKDVLRNLSNTDDKSDDSTTEMSITGARYFPWLISENGDFILLSAARNDENDENIRRHIYIPLYIDEENVSHDCFMAEEGFPAEVLVEILYRG